MKAFWVSALHLLLLIEGARSLRDVTISVPRAVLAGADARAALRCTYSLEGAALYALRWYRVSRGGAGEPVQVEFYRFVPREHPPHLVFPLLGTTVDVSASDGSVCVLSGLHRRLSGEFMCEVSADAPLFHTDIRAANLTVVEPPFHAPVIVARVSARGGEGEGAREGPGAGEGEGARVSARCSSDASYPPANLTWSLNGRIIALSISPEPAPDDFSEREAHSELELLLSAAHPAPETGTSGGPAPPVSVKMTGQRHSVSAAVWAGGALRLECAASLLGVWRRAADVTLAAPPPAPAGRTTHAGSSPLGWSLSAALLSLLFTAL